MIEEAELSVTFDEESGCSYIYLVGPIPKGGAKRQIMAGDDMVLDLDASGAVIGIELLDPRLLHPKLRARAVPPRGDPAQRV